MSSTNRLVCDGMTIDRYFIPPFAVNRGEAVRLQFPSERNGVAAKYRFRDLLLSSSNAIHPSGTIEVPANPQPGIALLELFHKRTAVEWLRRHAKLSIREAENLLDKVEIGPDTPLCTLAGTPRMLIGIQAAFAAKPAVLVFDTAGLDPLGVQRVLKAVQEQLGDAAAVQLCASPESDGISRVIEVLPAEAAPVS